MDFKLPLVILLASLYCLCVHQCPKWQIHTSAWANNPLSFYCFPSALDLSMWKDYISLLVCHHTFSVFASISSFSCHFCVPSGCRKKKEDLTAKTRDKMREMFCCFPHQWVWQNVCFFLSEQNLWKFRLDFTLGMMEWINLPGQDRVLTTANALNDNFTTHRIWKVLLYSQKNLDTYP